MPSFFVHHVKLLVGFLALVAAAFVTVPAAAAEPGETAGPDRRVYEQTVAKAIDYLTTKGRADDGSYSGHAGPGVTALVASALLKNGVSPADPRIATTLKHLETFVQPTGGIHHPESPFRNYETCMAVMCFQAANKDARYDKILTAADRFLRGLQWDEKEGHEKESYYYGGGGYGKGRRPDLSNTAFLIDALKSAGAGGDDQALQKALVFVSRCQNLESEHNTTPFAARINDGGFFYSAASGGNSASGATPEGGLRSYGAMTYAGLKSMIYAGLKADDPRVKAAVAWIEKHYDVSSNPGMGDSGLYYYYHTFAKALAALGRDQIADASGKTHDWRRELVEQLAATQRADGSWVNKNPKWLEGDANLATGFALLALSYCAPQ